MPSGRLYFRPDRVFPFLLFAMVFFASGFILVWACAKEVNLIELSGCAIGLANMGGFLGAAIVQPLFGWALDKRWQGLIEEGVRIYPLEAWRFAFLLALVILLSTNLIGILIKEPQKNTFKSRRQIRQYEATQA